MLCGGVVSVSRGPDGRYLPLRIMRLGGVSVANISRSQADMIGAEIAEQNRQINDLARRVKELEAVARKAHERLDGCEATIEKAREAFKKLKGGNN